MFLEFPEGGPKFPRMIYDTKVPENSRPSTSRRRCSFSQVMMGLIIFLDFVLKVRNTAAVSGKYLCVFSLCFCSDNKELTCFK